MQISGHKNMAKKDTEKISNTNICQTVYHGKQHRPPYTTYHIRDHGTVATVYSLEKLFVRVRNCKSQT